MLTVAQFRLFYPAFSDPEKYPDAAVQHAIDQAYRRLPECSWGELLDDGVGLYAAHMLFLRGPAGSAGGGAVGGIVTSKKVDRVQVNYDVSRTTFEGQAYWNSSTYGIEFWQLASVIGMAPMQLL